MDEQVKKQSYILITFPEIGSALMDMKFEGVTAGQLFIAAKVLELKAQSGFIQEETERMQREAERNIARPTQSILKP